MEIIRHYLRQPWVQILIGIVALTVIGFVIYYYGKSAAFAESKARQSKWETNALAERAKATAAEERMIVFKDRADKLEQAWEEGLRFSEANKIRILNETEVREAKINEKFSKTIAEIPNLSDCDICNRVCRNWADLADADVDFEKYICPPEKCDRVCKNDNVGTASSPEHE